MKKIEIVVSDYMPHKCSLYKFVVGGIQYTSYLMIKCSVCGNSLIDDHYKHILDDLKKAKLIPEDYPILCCECFPKHKPEPKTIGK